MLSEIIQEGCDGVRIEGSPSPELESTVLPFSAGNAQAAGGGRAGKKCMTII